MILDGLCKKKISRSSLYKGAYKIEAILKDHGGHSNVDSANQFTAVCEKVGRNDLPFLE